VKAAEGEKAARAMGWDFHLVDGNFGFAGAYAAGIRTAIAASPDAIVTDAFPCTDVQQPLQEAKDAGILVLGMESTDCSDVGGPKLYTAPMSANSTEDTEAKYFEGFGKYSADYIIAASDGKAKIINSPGQNSQQQLLNDAFVAEIDKCAGCEIVADVKWSTEDFKPNGAWTQGFRSAVIQHPEATAVYAPFDSMAASFGGSQAIVEAGRDICSGTPPYPSDCVIAVGGIGTNETLDLVRDGKWTALGSARDHEWMAWGVVDNLNRAFNGEPPAPEGIGFTAVDKSSGLPSKAGEHFHSQIDFRAAYLAAWGVG
jgi:ribose transport system substrate-binding protein